MNANLRAPEPAEAVAEDPIVQLCAFRVGDEDYVIDIMRIREIIQPLKITPVPRAPEFIEGVVNLRGQVIPIVDVRKRFGLPPSPVTRKSKFLIVNVAGRVMGLVVDAVSEVLRLPRSQIQAAPQLMAGDGPRFFLGVCGAQAAAPAPANGRAAGGQRLRLLLNVKALLDPGAPEQLAAARQLAREARQ